MHNPFDDNRIPPELRPQPLGYVGPSGGMGAPRPANANGSADVGVNGKGPANPNAPGPAHAAPGVTPLNGMGGLSAMGIQPGGIHGMGGLGDLDASGHGVTVTMPGPGGHVLTVGLSAALGAGIGGMASGTLQGAAIGASGNLAVLGLVNAIFGKGFTGVGGRVAYGILGALGLAGTAWLLVRRHRRR